jgi:hypothetical protein
MEQTGGHLKKHPETKAFIINEARILGKFKNLITELGFLICTESKHIQGKGSFYEPKGIALTLLNFY